MPVRRRRTAPPGVMAKACHYPGCLAGDPTDPNFHEHCQELRQWFRRYEDVMA